MSTARNGKVARLPHEVREELNRKLRDGQEGRGLVKWLNDLEEVQVAMCDYFEGRKLTEQNLSEWKKGGYLDWLKHQEALDWARLAGERAKELIDEGGGVPVSDHLAGTAAIALGQMLRALTAGAMDKPEERQVVTTLLREVSLLRRDDHEAAQLRLAVERRKEQLEEKRKREAAEKRWEPYKVLFQAEREMMTMGYFTKGRTPEQLEKLKSYFRMWPDLDNWTKQWAAADPSESESIRPDQTDSG